MTYTDKSHFSPSRRTPARPAYYPDVSSQSKIKHVVLFDAKSCKAEPLTNPCKEICISSRGAERVSSLLYRMGRASAASSSSLSDELHTAGLCYQCPHTNSELLPPTARRELRPSRAFTSAPTKPAAYAKTCITSDGNPQSPLFSKMS